MKRPTPALPLTSSIDHLVVVADSLAHGAAWCEAVLGVAPGPGGRHALMGTHNRLLPIGAPQWPQAYLEIIAIDPDAAAPVGRSRWFGMDDPALRAAVQREPQLVHFVAQSDDVQASCAALAAIGEDVGQPIGASRETPQGVLRWQITLRADGEPQHGGGLPALIEWKGPHPSASMAAAGLSLLDLTVRAADPAALRRAWAAIGLAGIGLAEMAPGRLGPDSAVATPVLRARLATPHGEVTLTGGAPLGSRQQAQA